MLTFIDIMETDYRRLRDHCDVYSEVRVSELSETILMHTIYTTFTVVCKSSRTTLAMEHMITIQKTPLQTQITLLTRLLPLSYAFASLFKSSSNLRRSFNSTIAFSRDLK